MAILREGIALGNEQVERMRVMSKELASISSEMISYLNANANFQLFRQGTERGAGIYNNLNTCVNTIVEQLVPAIDRISTSTSNLLNEQQNLNKARESEVRR